MGTLISLKRNLYKKGNKISAHIEELGILELRKTKIIPAIQVDYLELPIKQTENINPEILHPIKS